MAELGFSASNPGPFVFKQPPAPKAGDLTIVSAPSTDVETLKKQQASRAMKPRAMNPSILGNGDSGDTLG